MELACFNIKKILIFSQKEVFFIFSQMKPCTFQPQIKKIKKYIPRKFLILQETETRKYFSYFLKRKVSFYFRKQNFLSSKNEKTRPEKTSYISGKEIFQTRA